MREYTARTPSQMEEEYGTEFGRTKMFKEMLREVMKPIVKEVYEEGYKDGERRVLKAFEYGWNVGHADTMAMLGEISLEEATEKELKEAGLCAKESDCVMS